MLKLRAEPEAAAKEWYKKHATVPVNHMVVVKSALAKFDPGVVREIFRMLQAGKKAAGLPKPGVLVSANYTSLHPGYYIVFSGVFSTPAAASRALATVRARGFPGAYVARVTHS